MIIGSRFIFFKDIESTNTLASGLLQSEPVSDGTIIYTNYQSGGRGQKGNRWESENGKNLLFSIVLFPMMVRPEEQFIISIFVSLGICDFLKTLIPECKIKWPNDIYTGDDKIAGILIENSIISNSIVNSVVGIGLNINQQEFPEEVPNPVSLRILTGREYNTDYCLKQLAGNLDGRYKQVISESPDKLRDEYITSLYRLNEWHRFRSENRVFEGRIVSVTNAGCLRIEDKAGIPREFLFREIDFIV